ncbi:hypothetical protein GCM10009760_15560 [Kitasatospora kazusensis]|uniref:Phenyloxazoline synthase MbtB n=2 Tax=Kitasatospora kazusensis TaxID=407974 RepID=A0ABP5KRB9_9ACTN
MLGCDPQDLADHDDLAEHGMDSIRMMDLAGRFRRQGVPVTFPDLARRPTVAAWSALAGARLPEARPPAATASADTHPHHAHPGHVLPATPAAEVDGAAPFPLTPVQHAYWVGRRDDQVLGGVGCHAYFEFDGSRVDPGRLEHAVRRVISRHGMLRARFLADGRQQVMPVGGWPGLVVHDLREEPGERVAARLAAVRESLSHHRTDVARGEVLDLELSLLPGTATRIHLGIDLLVADVESIRILLADLARAYLDPDAPHPAAPDAATPEFGFPHYLADRAARRAGARERAREYWQDWLAGLPDGPALPLATDPALLGAPRFTRRRHRLEPAEWQRFARRAREGGTTPAMALATAYAEVLAAWSESPRFLLNLPLFDREAVHPAVPGMVADFTDLLLLDLDLSGEAGFADRARAVQDGFREAAAHCAYSGVEVLRDLARTHPGGPGRAPVVFACTLGSELVGEEFRSTLGELGWMISQTPQVWLDHQVYESRGGVDLCWDSADDLFPPGLLDDMFGAYRELADRLSAPDADWAVPARPPLPRRQRAVRDRANSTAGPLTGRGLHQEFFRHAASRPDRPALLWGDGSALSYGELARQALGVAGLLRSRGLRSGEPVAVSLPRGAGQVAAVLGVLAAGGAYVPVGTDQPARRRERILRRADVRLLLTDAGHAAGAAGLPPQVAVLDIETACEHPPLAAPAEAGGGAPAYVIFTSGTTGEPKGVMVAHGAASNTVDDVNERFAVGPADRVLGVSALDFDLSVYDVFGPLSAGGALVLVAEDQRRDPAAWAGLIARHGVTVWNSVPVLLDMLLTGPAALPRLRLALVSGDWIGLDLPGRLARQAGPACRFAALGGATEAAIWSNLFEVTDVPPGWTSIPYGAPLRNQCLRVVGPAGHDCPDWTPGELWIGGAGVALGYLGDPALTRDRFVDSAGGRWYRTGDRARYWPDGTVEFLGRRDQQVKIRGVRTEPGEIEAALGAHPSVGRCVVAAVGPDRARRLVAVATPAARPSAAAPAPDPDPDPAAGTGPAAALPAVTGEEDEARLVESVLARLLVGEAGVTTRPTAPAELARRWGATPEWQPLLGLWSDWLTTRGVLSRDRNGYAAGPRLAEVCRRRAADDPADGRLAPVAERLRQRAEELAAVLRGGLDHRVLLDDPVLAPAALAARAPGAEQALAALAAALPGSPGLEIAVLGAGGGSTVHRLLRSAPAHGHRYTLLDGSAARLDAAARLLAGHPGGVGCHRLAGGLLPGGLLARFDVVLADQALHAEADPAEAARLAALLLVPGGLLLAVERTELPPLALIAAAVPTRGFTDLDPVRRSRRSPLLPVARWHPLLAAHGLDPATGGEALPGGHVLLRAVKAPDAGLPTDAAVREWLAARLPTAMLPDRLFGATTLPVTANGKVDRAALLAALPPEDPAGSETEDAPHGPVETALAAAWCEVLGLPRVGRGQGFFTLGGDSLLATRLVGRLREAGFAVDLAAVFATPVLRELAATVTPVAAPAAGASGVTADHAHRHDPFPPTDVQRAYWTGRDAGLPLGGVGAHYYLEFDGPDLDLPRLETAWNLLIARHEMLRAVFDEDGGQRILPEVPEVTIPVVEAAGPDGLRAAMSHQLRDPAVWPLLDLRAVVYRRDGERRVRLGLSLPNIVLDGRSMMIVLAELAALHRSPDAALPPVDGLSFRDYLLQAGPGEAELAAAERYWRSRLAELPPAPRLPLATDPAKVTAPRFARRSGLLPASSWQRVTDRARAYGLTPSAVLLACYAEVLGRWSTRRDLTVNLTLFDRQEVHPAVDDIVGDFTSLLLVAYEPSPGAGFLERARALQLRLGQDLGHRAWSAVRVARELARAEGVADRAVPVVFTSALGTPRDLSLDLSDWLLPRVWGVSQTPQTWLDNQVYDSPRGLHYDWDAVEELFPPGVLDAMFTAYGQLLDWTVESDWNTPVPDLLPAGQRAVRTAVNATTAPIPQGTLHDAFFTHAATDPDRCALHWETDGRMSYGQLADHALRIAALLRHQGVEPSEPVAVTLPKGPDQLAAVLGILALGAAYVPIGTDQPEHRRQRMLTTAGIHHTLDQQLLQQAAEYEPLTRPAPAPGNTPAYIIFTSGSTGEPKGVEVTHTAALNTIHDINNRCTLTPHDRLLALSALDFDLSVYDIFGPLTAGAAIVLIQEHERRDPERWLDLMTHHQVTLWNSVPMLLDMLLTTTETTNQTTNQTTTDPTTRTHQLPPSLRLALTSGDWVGTDLHPRLTTQLPHCRLIALGGATEAAIWSNAWETTPNDPPWTSVPYGHPLTNQHYRTTDTHHHDTPDWVPGELWISGTGLATGYRNDPTRTTEKFIHHQGTRWYRTGDLGRYHPDGTLEFLGRTDHQLKINGHRIEPGEIETTLHHHPTIRHAVVTADDSGPGRRLLAHVVADDGGTDVDELRAFLAERLPRHAVPAEILLLAALPLTANGKVDRAALAAAAPATPSAAAGEPPRTAAERLVGEVWSEVLGRPDPARDSDFFALGGDSLLAAKVVSRLRSAGAGGARISGLFSTPVLAGFAAGLSLGAPPEQPPAPVLAVPADRHLPFAPTELQRAYWVGRSPSFTLGGVGSYYYCEFDGTDLDPGRLETVWNLLIARHETLRAVFDQDGSQLVLPEVPRLVIPVVDAPGAAADAALAALRAQMSHQVLDPSVWPLFDVRAVRYGRGRTRVGIGLDYLLVDGLSMMVLFAELDLLLRDPDAELPPIGVSFRDYACQAGPTPAERDRSLSHWRERLPELPPPPALPLAVDPAAVARPRFVRRETWLGPDRWQALQARARDAGCTPSALLLACYAEVLGVWSTRRDLTVALTLFDRRAVHPDIERVLGDFTSLLPVAYEPRPGEPFGARVRRLKERLGRDLDHRDAPVLALLREAAGPQAVAEATLPVVFTSALGVADALSDGLRRPVWSVSQTPQVWLDEQVMVRDGGLLITWDAVEELFPPGVLDAMFTAYGQLLDWTVESDWNTPVPDLLPAGQRAVRTAVNATTAPIPQGTLHDAFFTHAATDPDRCALHWETDGRMSYGQLADHALRIAALLRHQGVEPSEPVAVTLPKGPDQLAAVLGILALGAAYVPIGTDQPEHRRQRMLTTAGIHHTLDQQLLQQAAEYEPLTRPAPAPGNTPAYIIFTSGSTGEPKGVEVTHTAALNTIHDINNRCTLTPHDRLLALSALDFDLSVYDIFGPLTAGAAIVLIQEHERRDPERWLDLMTHHQVTLWNSVPMLLDMLLTTTETTNQTTNQTTTDPTTRTHQLPPSLRLALTSGDWVGTDLHPRLTTQLPHCRLIALGGATEAAIWSNAWETTPNDPPWTSVPYGHPLTNQHYRTTDTHHHDTPDWVPGELWISGTGLATGYRNDPTRTTEKFIHHQGTRWYRTGDLGRYHPDGTLEFLGRTDHQLKINGHRIEPGEIETTLHHHPTIRHAVVIPVGERGSRRLHAFVATGGAALDTAELQDYLADRLPPYARPSGLTVLDALPLSANGKVDRAALRPPAEPAGGPAGVEAPRGPVESALAELWSGLLGRAAVPRDATFFALGGDSLLATRLVQRLRDRFGCEMSLRQLLSEPTIAGLATLIERQHPGTEAEDTEDGTL